MKLNPCQDHANKGETMGSVNSLDKTYCATLPAVILHNTASHVATIITNRPMHCINVVMWEIGSNSHKTIAVVAMKRKKARASATGSANGQCQGTDVRAEPTEVQPRIDGTGLSPNTDIWPLFYTLLTLVLAYSLPPLPLTLSCPHIVDPQPLVHMQHEGPINRRSSSFPRTKVRNPHQYPRGVRESPNARERKEKYSK